jgi:hypothetical protein
MNIETALSKAAIQVSHLEEYKRKTGIETHLLTDESELPLESTAAEDEITKRLTSQIGNSEKPKEEAKRLMSKNSTPEQKSYLRQLIERVLDRAFEPVFLALKEKTGIDGEMIKKGISRGLKRLNLMVSNATSQEKKEAFKGDPMGRFMDIFFPKDKDKTFLAGCFVAWDEYCKDVKDNLPKFESWMRGHLNEVIGQERTNKVINITKDILSKDKTSLAFLGTGVGLTAGAALPALLAIPVGFAAYLLPVGILSLETIKAGLNWKDKHNIKPDIDPYKLLEEDKDPQLA